MSEEEKEAIETVRFLKDLKWYEHAFDNGTEVLEEEEKQDIDIVLNLIDKQQEKIEELQKQIKDITSIPNDEIRYDEEGNEI